MLTVIVPTSDAQLNQLSWLLLGLRQQALEPSQWSLLLLHCGDAAALEAALAEFRARIRDRLTVQTLVLPASTTPAEALAAAEALIQDRLLLFLQPGYQPHRSLLEVHHRFHAGGGEIAIGSSQFHPEQALTRFAMASQIDQLLFNFFPMPVSETLPYTSFQFHNLSLPQRLLPALAPRLRSWRFAGWDAGLRLWRRGLRAQALHEARTCLTAPLNLDTALAIWLSEAGSDLADFLELHPFPLPALELDWPAAALPVQALEQLHQQLRQTQAEISIPIERGDPVEQALQAWKQLLHELWRGKALALLPPDPEREPVYPLPWRQPEAAAQPVPAEPQPTPLRLRWRERHGAGLLALARRYPQATVETGEQPSFLSAAGLPWLPLDQAVPAATRLVLLTEGPFDALLRRFLQLETELAPRSLLLLGPLTPALQQLQRLILDHYAWIALERNEGFALLCKLGSEA